MALGYEAVYELRDLPKAVRPKIHPDAAAAPSVALVVIWPRRIIRAAGGSDSLSCDPRHFPRARPLLAISCPP